MYWTHHQSRLLRTVPSGCGAAAQATASRTAAVLAKDAFLVFRALCKLSIRTADATTHTDFTALRGKACSPAAQAFPWPLTWGC